MLNFRFNLDKTYVDRASSQKASALIKEGKKVPKSLFNTKETSIYISVSFKKHYLKVNTGLKIKPEFFDTKNQVILKRNETYNQLQLVLDKIKNKCSMAYHELYLKEVQIDVMKLKTIMEEAVLIDANPKTGLSLFEVYAIFYDWKSKRVHKNTMPRYNVLKERLKQFQTYRKRTIIIEEINKNFSEEFAIYLMEVHGLFNNTVAKYLKSLKSFLRFAYEQEYISNKSFLNIDSAEDPASIFVLDDKEIDRIFNLDSKHQIIKDVRDAFCFLCFTGQRYGDLKAMQWKDIVKIKGRKFWRLYQNKTRSTTFLDIPLLPQAVELINRHNRGRKKEDFVFRVPNNAMMNAELKTIARLAKIKGEFTIKRRQGSNIVEETVKRHRKLTTHAGRKSFVTNALKKGLPITVVQKISGHTSIKAMKPYIQLSETYVADQLFEFFK